MDEHQLTVLGGVTQIMMAIDAPYESVKMLLDQHPCETMGDPEEEGSGAWHLKHMCEIFRVHAKAVMGETEVASWPSMPKGLRACAMMLKEDAMRFTMWCMTHVHQIDTVTYGEEMSFEEMTGIMSRHIVWHAAAVHYWCTWKGGSAAS